MKLKNILRQLFNSRAKKMLRILPHGVQNYVYKYRDHVIGIEDPFETVPRVYITLRCNLTCPYCSDGLEYDMSEMKYELLAGEKWVEIINALPGNTVIFTGGEPTLHPDLPYIINTIRQSNVFLYTNLAYNVKKFMDQLSKPVSVFSSFHPNNKAVTLESSIEALKILRDHPMCKNIVSHHLIMHSSNGTKEQFNYFKSVFKSNGFDLLLYGDQFVNNFYGLAMCDFKNMKKVVCSRRSMLVAPDGQRCICVSKMIRKTVDRIVPYDATIVKIDCDEFGKCSPCDEAADITFKQT